VHHDSFNPILTQRFHATPVSGLSSVTWAVSRNRLGRLDVFPSGDVGAAHTLGRVLGRVIEPPDAVRFAARFAPLRGMLYFCMLGYMLGAP